MRSGGLLAIARSGLSALLRLLARLPLWLGELLSVAADIADPDMPETILRPREWLPRLWARHPERDPADRQY
ncbi:hypothetical protein [Methylobacterium soli]|uniref:Uncharacterized protein n=1 Tax=Methylobacterium soli TaxID=553447 RepID=A0A6L3SYZ3_9HYPH|nr:hypothetical protein [Methylobacterium soli]KAB1079349.1 hypothetical protein F6X53_11115 [Methylobacterium soli]GJE41278.1 hypothetical protein AEGHOMDF_0440 [Methylobacterium soli]